MNFLTTIFMIFVVTSVDYTYGYGVKHFQKDGHFKDICDKWEHYDIVIDNNEIKTVDSSLQKLEVNPNDPQSIGSVSFKDCIADNGYGIVLNYN